MPREVVLEPATMLQHEILELLTRRNCEPVNEDRDTAKDSLFHSSAAGISAGKRGRGSGGVELLPELPVLFGHVTGWRK